MTAAGREALRQGLGRGFRLLLSQAAGSVILGTITGSAVDGEAALAMAGAAVILLIAEDALGAGGEG